MLSLQDGKARKLHYYNTIKAEKVSSLQKDFKANKVDGADLFWAYHQLIIEEIKWPANKGWEEIWKKLTKAQKILITLGHFIGQTNNGGVWQFLFNRVDYALAAAEAFYELKPAKIWVDYENVWEEFVKMANAGEFSKIMDVWNDQSISFEDRWKAFKSGAEFIPTGDEIQEYFYTEDYKKQFYQKVNGYIEQNLGKLAEVELEAGNERKIIKKKEAIPHFKAYLKEVYNQDVEELSIYYTGRVTIDNQGTQLFLMHYKLPDGYESIGVTGYFTLHLEDAPMEEINKMYKKYHKQELVNLYHGYYLVEQELLKNPKANQVNEKKWKDFLEKIQAAGNSQVPVNVEFLEYFKLGKKEWYIYKGDLLYNDNKAKFPKDLSHVDLTGVGDKTSSPYRGERNLIFHSTGKLKDGFGRRAQSSPITGKYPLYDIVGASNKLLKDNPWGF
jgi:hypothetical protein